MAAPLPTKAWVGILPKVEEVTHFVGLGLLVVGDAVELCELDDMYVVHEGRLQFVVGIGTHASVMHRSSLWSTCLINRCANTVTIERKVCRFYNISPPLRAEGYGIF